MPIMVENLYAQTVTPANGRNPRQLYEHQEEAMKCLDAINRKDSFRTLLVLPTGGGKTMTAAYWLLRNAVDKGKKILWTAHRHLLLEQAAEAFVNNAYTDIMVNHTVFNYRIISGMHDKPVNIRPDDNIIIAGKDSIVRRLDMLDDWLNDEDIFLVIDEAHHAVARSYKKIIAYAEKHARSIKLIGLTATPFRTADDEKGALKQVFTDDIVYKVDLETLIKKGILATPRYDSYETEVTLFENIGVNAMKSIENFDMLPDKIADDIANNKERNSMIVNKYFEKYKEYGPTIVFAVNQNHAIALNALFNRKGKEYGIRSEYIISSVRDIATGITVSNEDNERKIEAYRKGDIQVLINVNILTEGTDLPKTHTVFLTRPTVSTVLMTQMVGRALRGLKAGGTKDAYIVNFVDISGSIAWVNPQTLSDSEYHEHETEAQKRINEIRLISISKIEEFALMADSAVDTSVLDRLSATELIPLGMYIFTTFECSCQILVYNSSEKAYKSLIADLPNIMEHFGVDDETIPDDKLAEMTDFCCENYFSENMVPKYNKADIAHLLEFYAQKETAPSYVTLDQRDRETLDVSEIAKKIYDEDMRRSEKAEYIDRLWNEEGCVIPTYYSNKLFFRKLIDNELCKLDGDIKAAVSEPQTEAELRGIEHLTLHKITELYPTYGSKLREDVLTAAKNEKGHYVCAGCGREFATRSPELQIDHIVPMSKGGLTVPANLQLLCRTCNMRKSDKE